MKSLICISSNLFNWEMFFLFMTYHSKRNFSLLTIGQFVSIVGDRISTAVFLTIAAAIVATTQSTYQSSIIIVFQTLPFLLFGYLFGLMADLVEKRKILIFADIARAAVLISLYFYHESLMFLYFCVFAIGFLTAMFDPAKKSILPFLVKRDKLIFFNKFYAVIEIIGMMIGLGFGAFLLSKIGIERALLFDASTYIFSMILFMFLSYHDENEVLKTKKNEGFRSEVSRHVRELAEGWKYLVGNDNVRFIIFNLVFFHFLAVAIFSSSIIDFSIRSFDFGKEFLIGTGFDFGDLLVGSHTTFIFLFVAIGALTSPIFKMIFRRVKESALSVYVFFFGAAMSFLLVFASRIIPADSFYPVFVLSMIVMGATVGTQYIRVAYLIQMHTDKEFMGRIVSLADITWGLALFFGMLIGSYLNEIFTYEAGLLLGGLVYLAGGISFWFSRGKISW